VDFDLLTAPEREVLLALARGASPAARLEDLLPLERLGLVRRVGDGRLEIANPILRQWLRELADQKL
jgi:hypothetical protein